MNPLGNSAHLPQQLPRITLPLSPLLPRNGGEAVLSKRIRPEDSLNLVQTLQHLSPSILTTVDVAGKPWSVISVFSPYSPDVHVMIMETSPDRYLPGPEAIPTGEGDAAAALMAKVLQFIRARPETDNLHFGYNWSPRSWGEFEERGGFQSVPTKWHAMIWGWPSFSEGERDHYCLDQVARKELSLPARRIFGEGEYIKPLGDLFIDRITETLSRSGTQSYISEKGWMIDYTGPTCFLSSDIISLVRNSHFFSGFLQPIAVTLDRLLADLTESFTDMKCDDFEEMLRQVHTRPLREDEIKILRAPPALLDAAEIPRRLRERNLPTALSGILLEAITARCREEGDHTYWWRKGFGYSLVFSAAKEKNETRLRLLPGVYVGPGGVVEAHGVLLRRLLDCRLSPERMSRRSAVLWELADFLEEHFHKVTGSMEDRG